MDIVIKVPWVFLRQKCLLYNAIATALEISILLNTVKPLKTDTPRDEQKCPSYRGVRLTTVRLIKVFLCETHLRSAGTRGSVRLREVSVLWEVRLKRF